MSSVSTTGHWVRVFFLAGTMLVGAQRSPAQVDTVEKRDAAISSSNGPPLLAGLLTVLVPLWIPKAIADGAILKDYVRSEEFAYLRAARGDLAAVDAIFDRAKELSWGNLYEALLLSATATFDHRRVGVDIPVLGPLVWFPLSSEFEEEFLLRQNAIPGQLYPDSPADRVGDRDKLQHFFGSAFLAHTFESRRAAGDVGTFVEWGEDRFVVGGASDDRDRRANLQGQEFGLRLLENRGAKPSEFFRFEIAVHKRDL